MNYNYFDNITTETQAYLLGFLAAKANFYKSERKIKEPYYYLGITVQPQYINTIKLLETELDYKFESYKCNHAQSFMYRSKKVNELFKSLQNYGFTSNKTKNFDFRFDKIPIDLLPHTIRGYLEHSATIYYKRKHNQTSWASLYLITFRNYQFIDNLKETLQTKFNIQTKTYQSYKTTVKYSKSLMVLKLSENLKLFNLLYFQYQPKIFLKEKKWEYHNKLAKTIKHRFNLPFIPLLPPIPNFLAPDTLHYLKK